MHQFARSYARHSPVPAERTAQLKPSLATPPKRVRIVKGALQGMTGRIVSTVDQERWLIEADQRGLLVRISPAFLEPLPSA